MTAKAMIPAKRIRAGAFMAAVPARDGSPWHFLNFLPLPHGQGSLGSALADSDGPAPYRLIKERGGLADSAGGFQTAASTSSAATGSSTGAENLVESTAPKARPQKISRFVLG